MTATHIKEVTASFAASASTAEGFIQRAWLVYPTLPSPSGLAKLFRSWEWLGDWATEERALLTAMFPKPDGGLRLVALFRTLYRVYARARAADARKWHLATPNSWCNESAGRGVGDSTWRMQVLSALGEKEGASKAKVLLDIKKAFEHVLRRNSSARPSSVGIRWPACT